MDTQKQSIFFFLVFFRSLNSDGWLWFPIKALKQNKALQLKHIMYNIYNIKNVQYIQYKKVDI